MPKKSSALIEVANTASNLGPCPIEPSWIIEGNPVAQSVLMSKSADGQAWTVVWQCSEGKFNWYYGVDETILILGSSIVLENDVMPPTRYGPGDVVFFKKGALAKWHVEGHVRKLAFCRRTQPVLLGFAWRVLVKVKRTLMPARKRTAVGLKGPSPTEQNALS